MGLDTTHDAWHGAYSAFMRWRRKLANIAGLPPLDLMEGFYFPERHSSPDYVKECLPIKWKCLKPDALHILLSHSDCDDEIGPEDCAKIADRLTELLPLLPDGEAGGHIRNWRNKTQQFIDGCRRAATTGERLEFD